MLFLIIVFSMLTAAHVLLNWLLIHRYGIYIEHTTEALIAVIVHATVALIAAHSDDMSLKHVIVVCTVWPSIRWVLFDLGLNLLRDKPLFYIGSGENAASTDKLLGHLLSKGVPIWLTKAVALSASILLAYYISNSPLIN